MSNNPNQLVQKLWNYCNVGSLAPARSGLRPFAQQKPLRAPPGGSSLKMADEQSRPPFNKRLAVLDGLWLPNLLARIIGQPLSSQT